jgi:hypothetical protein
MLNVRLADTLEALLLDELCDPSKPRPHVLGQRLEFCVHGFVQRLD